MSIFRWKLWKYVIQMKATKLFGMELFAFRQFSKTKTWRFCWTSWLLGTARNQRLRPQRLIDYYLHSYLCVTLRSVFLWFCQIGRLILEDYSTFRYLCPGSIRGYWEGSESWIFPFKTRPQTKNEHQRFLRNQYMDTTQPAVHTTAFIIH